MRYTGGTPDIPFISIRLCCIFHFISFQTKHGFDIGIGPVSFNLAALDKDTPLVWVGFRQVPFFFQFDAAVNQHLNWKTKKKTKIRLMLTINCLTKAYEKR